MAWLKTLGASLYETLIETPVRAAGHFVGVGPSVLLAACAEGDVAKCRALIDDDRVAPTGAMLLTAARRGHAGVCALLPVKRT